MPINDGWGGNLSNTFGGNTTTTSGNPSTSPNGAGWTNSGMSSGNYNGSQGYSQQNNYPPPMNYPGGYATPYLQQQLPPINPYAGMTPTDLPSVTPPTISQTIGSLLNPTVDAPTIRAENFWPGTEPPVYNPPTDDMPYGVPGVNMAQPSAPPSPPPGIPGTNLTFSDFGPPTDLGALTPPTLGSTPPPTINPATGSLLGSASTALPPGYSNPPVYTPANQTPPGMAGPQTIMPASAPPPSYTNETAPWNPQQPTYSPGIETAGPYGVPGVGESTVPTWDSSPFSLGDYRASMPTAPGLLGMSNPYNYGTDPYNSLADYAGKLYSDRVSQSLW